MESAASPSGRLGPVGGAFARRIAVAGRIARHRRFPDAVFVALSLVAFALLLYLGRNLTFFGDEWEFISHRQDDLTLQTLMEPHAEHWSLFPVLVYKALFSVFGLRSYLPYLGVLLALHVTAVTGLFLLLRRCAGPIVALGGATLMLFLGSAYEDLFWAFQIGFVGSVAAGLWALVVIERSVDRRALAVAGGLLIVAVASSGLGLPFLVVVGALALFDPSRRRAALPALIAGVVYVAWFVTFGRHGIDASHSPLSVTALAGIPDTVIAGGGHGIAGLMGVAKLPGAEAIFILLVVAVAAGLIRGMAVPGLAIAALAGLLAQFVLIGLTRDQLQPGPQAAVAPRYIYASAVFLLTALVALIGEPARRSASWRQGVAVASIVGLALVGNAAALPSGRDFFLQQARQLRAATAWIEDHPVSPLVEANVHLTPYTIGAADVLRLVERYGSFTHDEFLPGIVPPISPADTDRALFGMVAPGFGVAPTANPAPTPGLAGPSVTGSQDLVSVAAGGCLALRATGPAPTLSVSAPAGASLLYLPDAIGTLKAYLSLQSGPDEADSVSVDVIGGLAYSIAIPDAGATQPWTLSLIPPADPLAGRLCATAPPP